MTAIGTFLFGLGAFIGLLTIDSLHRYHTIGALVSKILMGTGVTLMFFGLVVFLWFVMP